MKQRFLRLNLMLLAIIVALGVVLWHRYYYDPQVAIYRALPKGHHLACRVDADVDGDGIQEVIFTSGPDSRFDEKATSATVTVLHWRRSHWRKVWSFTEHQDDLVTVPGGTKGEGGEVESLAVEDINDDGRKEMIFRSAFHGGSGGTTYFRLFCYDEGRYRSLLTNPLCHPYRGGVFVRNLDPKRSGKEIVCWGFLRWNRPPSYYVTLLAWNGSRYMPYKDVWVETEQELLGGEREETVLRVLLDPSAVIKPRSKEEEP